LAILDHALATADLGLPVFPLSPLKKTPLLKANWREIATTDPIQIQAWFRDAPSANYGVATGDASDLFVVDIDNDQADRWWRSQGFPEGAVVRTPSGGRHIYYRTEGADVQTNQSTLHPGIDIRGAGGYVVGPGCITSTGTYTGDLRNIPTANPELVEFLPERQTYVTADVDVHEHIGDKVTEPTGSETRQIEHIVKMLDDLPRVWVEGAGWRSTAYRAACWLSRIANSSAYALTPDGAWAILREHTPTDSEWGEAELSEQWRSARQSTVGQYAELPREAIPNLLPFITVANKLPAVTSTGQSFISPDGILFGSADLDTPQKAWRRRQTILSECFRAGLSEEEAVTIAWASTAATALQSDPNGLSVLWGEVPKAKDAATVETGVDLVPPPDEARAVLDKRERVSLITDEERQHILDREWWGTRYLDWAETRVAVMNAPYHRLNRWFPLSAVFSDVGFIPMGQPQYLNFWGINLGPTTTGKTEAWNLVDDVLRACFAKGDNPNLGDDMSPEALIRVLIERDGKPSIFFSDEADGFFAKSKEGSWGAGMIPKLTKLHGCHVPVMHRQGDRDLSGVDATSYFSLYLMGTVAELTKVLETKYWKSGFLARPVWTLGENAVRGPDTWRTRRIKGDAHQAYTAMPKQWAAEFMAARQRLKAFGTFPLVIEHDQDALDRLDQFLRRLGKIAAGHPQEELLTPSFIRFGINIQICSALVALSEGRPNVTLSDTLIAIEQAEEWLDALIFMARETTTSLFARAVDEVEKFIYSKSGHAARLEEIHAWSPDELFVTNKHINQLIAEGRVEKQPIQGQDAWRLVVKQRGLIAA
jgi:hypothetical protein